MLTEEFVLLRVGPPPTRLLSNVPVELENVAVSFIEFVELTRFVGVDELLPELGEPEFWLEFVGPFVPVRIVLLLGEVSVDGFSI